mmetsp:Transcript_35656/g.64980  ORF Transcript_35656/g.64980 Transcript_35656/m.64980 type:complete len:268 (+) Transcript_35656:100-903(+)
MEVFSLFSFLCLFLASILGASDAFLLLKSTLSSHQRTSCSPLSGHIWQKNGHFRGNGLDSHASNSMENNEFSRRNFIAATIYSSGLVGVLSSTEANAFVDKKSTFEENLASILLSKKVLIPARRYIEIGQYDPARSNVNYCLNQFRLRKSLVQAVDRAQDFDGVDPELLDDAVDFVTKADNLIVQLDSSIYTMIFIPVEGAEMPADGRKFLKQCYLYYDLTMKGIDDVLALATPEQLAAAEAIASKIALPGFLFKEFKGDFYRPATP